MPVGKRLEGIAAMLDVETLALQFRRDRVPGASSLPSGSRLPLSLADHQPEKHAGEVVPLRLSFRLGLVAGLRLASPLLLVPLFLWHPRHGSLFPVIRCDHPLCPVRRRYANAAPSVTPFADESRSYRFATRHRVSESGADDLESRNHDLRPIEMTRFALSSVTGRCTDPHRLASKGS